MRAAKNKSVMSTLKLRKIFPRIPNTRLILILQDRTLDAELDKDLGKLLKVEKLPTAKHNSDFKFNRYVWEVKMNDLDKFKQSLSSYQKKHPNLYLSADEIKPYGPLVQYLGYVVGGVMGLINLVSGFL